jgi:uncharacterized repeat protein (TIGR03803 family)
MDAKFVVAFLSATILAACGGNSGLPSSRSASLAPPLAARKASVSEKVVYSFQGVPDGAAPNYGVINIGNTMYGTTDYGGAGASSLCAGDGGFGGCGTVFKLTTSGKEGVLHSFGSGADDGQVPEAGLLNVSGTLYGTTCCGGTHGDGTFFSVTTKGVEKVLYSFPGIEYPSTLIDVGGTLYGTTADGGKNGDGTVFKVTTAGKRVLLYSFGAGTDGQHPLDALIYVGGTLYGTTEQGGTNSCGSVGCGTVFKITTSGKENVIYNFAGGSSDGAYPQANLIDVNGTLYGTTDAGGAGTDNCYMVGKHVKGEGCGTVFSITTAGKETLLHSFGSGTDGKGPTAGLIDIDGTLYGTTTSGGAVNNWGTAFSVTTAGAETVLYTFGSATGDGIVPRGALLDLNGTLYGTTSAGGAHSSGTVFSLTGF